MSKTIPDQPLPQSYPPPGPPQPYPPPGPQLYPPSGPQPQPYPPSGPQPYPQPGFNIPPPQYDNIQHNYPPTAPPPQYDNIQHQHHQQQPVNVIIEPISFGETPVRMVCTNCQRDIVTTVTDEYSLSQHIACLVIFIFTAGICTCYSCVPYCIPSLYDARHQCPNCKTHLGTYKRCA
ncbi:lipopolysaccharide-induced tumor necrosis factor-alpha factor homolog [Planococcus citri]|uniref:lipopolysaccharide-induced tumor necrosis factor-alpha factor homolog n=1 Tax=Planococcus citri TaxID=170843 RepID=UPI0031F9BD46